MKKKETTQNEEVTLAEENTNPTIENPSNKEAIPPQKMGPGKIIGGTLVGGTVVATINQAFVSAEDIEQPNLQAANIRPVPVEEIETIDTTATLANDVEDGMTFNEAFDVARQELGPGGVFEWEGNIYNTYYKEEYDAMSDAQRTDYMAEAMNHAPETIVPASPTNDDNLGIEEDIVDTDTSESSASETIESETPMQGIVVDEPQTEMEETVVGEIINEDINTPEMEETVVGEIINEDINTPEMEETIVPEYPEPEMNDAIFAGNTPSDIYEDDPGDFDNDADISDFV